MRFSTRAATLAISARVGAGPSRKVSFDAERTKRGGHADRFWAVTVACQRERVLGRGRGAEIGVRVLG